MWRNIDYHLSLFWQRAIRHAEGMSSTEWVIVSLVVLGLGVLCLRGYGSRTNY